MSQPILTPVMPNVGIGKKLRAKFKQLGKSRDSQPRETTPLTVETTNTLIDYLYRIGAEQTEGIFRICGRTESVRALYESLTDKSGPKFPGAPEPDNQHIHTVASTLKMYLSRSDPPIFHPDAYDTLTVRGTKLDAIPMLDDLKRDIAALPDIQKQCLTLLIKFLLFVVGNSERNKMTITNCAIVFAPVLIRGKIESYEYIFHLQSHCKLIERLIEYSEFYLGDDSSPSPSPSPRPTLASVFESSSSSGLGSSSSSSSSLISSQPDSAESFDETEAIEEDQSEDEELFIPEDNSPPSDKPHVWKKKNFQVFQSVICKVCKKMIKTGLFGTTGYVCKDCNFAVHQACKSKLPLGCNPSSVSKSRTVVVGSVAPDFTFTDSQGSSFSLSKSALEGRKIVLFFYPKAFTPGCTAQNKTIRDAFSLFHYASCEVVGVSSDTMSCHKRFIERYNLPFRMISDPENRLRELFQVPSDFNGLAPGRVTYVIAPYTRTIVSIFNSQLQAVEHAFTALVMVSKMLLAEQRGESWDTFAEICAQD